MTETRTQVTEGMEHFPPGPALLYIPTITDRLFKEGGTSLYRVDNGTIMEGGVLSEDEARRERAVLRALLRHALTLVGED